MLSTNTWQAFVEKACGPKAADETARRGLPLIKARLRPRSAPPPGRGVSGLKFLTWLAWNRVSCGKKWGGVREKPFGAVGIL